MSPINMNKFYIFFTKIHIYIYIYITRFSTYFEQYIFFFHFSRNFFVIYTKIQFFKDKKLKNTSSRNLLKVAIILLDWQLWKTVHFMYNYMACMFQIVVFYVFSNKWIKFSFWFCCQKPWILILISPPFYQT